jgi:hypothetical protein
MIQHIDPFIGTDGAGNCLPGPYLPLGLVRLTTLAAAPLTADELARFEAILARPDAVHRIG